MKILLCAMLVVGHSALACEPELLECRTDSECEAWSEVNAAAWDCQDGLEGSCEEASQRQDFATEISRDLDAEEGL